jgi:hypothetical protein
MKLDIVTFDYGGKLKIKDFGIRPLSNLIPYNYVSEDLLIRPHQLNIARFYQRIKANFYTAIANPQLLSDWPVVIPQHQKSQYTNFKNWDDTYWAGTQRMQYSLYGTTHEILIPLWIEQIGDLSKMEISIGLIPDGMESAVVFKRLSFQQIGDGSFHDKFCQYLKNYFDYTGLTNGNNKCMKVDLKKNETYIYGLNVQDGNVQTRTDFNITRNLLFRERPLLEANSLLTNAFQDTTLIAPQMINLNICFNAMKWIPSSARHLFSSKFRIYADVKVDGKTLKKYDIFTNHQFVPRPVNEDIYTGSDSLKELKYNALDYKHDYRCTDIMHKNKIVQPICHWQMQENPDVLFNLYDGFGAAYKGYVVNHFFGTVNDLSSTQTDPIVPNTSPFGPKRIGDGDEIEYILSNVRHYYEDEPYFISLANGWVNGFRIQYTPNENSVFNDILIAGMTTPEKVEVGYHKTSDTQFASNPDYFAIWTDRFGPDGESTLPNLKDYTWDAEGRKWYRTKQWSVLVQTVDGDSKEIVYTKTTYLSRPMWDSETQQMHWETDWVITYEADDTITEIPDPDPEAENDGWSGTDITEENYDDPQEAYSKYKQAVHDREYDVALYHDMDNRWGYGSGGYTHSHRFEINSYGLYFCPRIVDWPTKQDPSGKALAVIIWDQTAKEGNTTKGLIYRSHVSNQNIGFIIEALREYIKYVKASPWWAEHGDEPNNPLVVIINGLSDLDNSLQESTFPGVWYFVNTIYEKQDNKVSDKSSEIIYRKGEAKDAFVYRFDGFIKPAMYPLAFSYDEDGNFQYSKKFGLNYLWFKDTYDNVDSTSRHYNIYAKTGVPPRYPSVDYDCMISDPEYGQILMPDTPISQLDSYKESKWFDRSIIAQYPVQLQSTADLISTTSKEEADKALKEIMFDVLHDRIGDELYDDAYVKSIYNIKYDLLRCHYQKIGRVNQLLYTYKITMKLK